jgi:large subunit ribosomal protein L25
MPETAPGTAAIAAEKLVKAGKGTARAERRAGRIPGVVYGNGAAPQSITMDAKPLIKELHRAGFMNRVYDLAIGGEKQRVLAREIQLDPVSDRPIHIDFMRVAPKSRVRLMIPVNFTGMEASPGIKRGGVLNVVRHTIEFYCPADSIPESITGSIAGLDIGDSLHISAIPLPPGVKPVITVRDFTVATVAAPTLLAEAEEEKPTAAAEGAVEGAVPAEGAEGAPAPADAKGKAGAPADAKGKAAAPAEKGKAEAKGKPAEAKGKAPAAEAKGKGKK